jgi:uncharacterized protein YPO0396
MKWNISTKESHTVTKLRKKRNNIMHKMETAAPDEVFGCLRLAALRSQQEADQAKQEFEQTANEYIKAENERNQRIGNAIEEVEKAQSELNELDRRYAADVAQRTAEGCTAKQFDQFGHVTLWSCPVK